MASSEDGVPGGLNKGDDRKSGHPDRTNRRSRLRIDDGIGVVVVFGSTFKVARAKRNRMGLIVNARTFPGGEKEVAVSNPRGLADSPQTMPTRAFHPRMCLSNSREFITASAMRKHGPSCLHYLGSAKHRSGANRWKGCWT